MYAVRLAPIRACRSESAPHYRVLSSTPHYRVLSSTPRVPLEDPSMQHASTRPPARTHALTHTHTTFIAAWMRASVCCLPLTAQRRRKRAAPYNKTRLLIAADVRYE